MKKNNSLILLIIFLICIFLTGCPIPSDNNNNDKKNDAGDKSFDPGDTLPLSIRNSTPLILPAGVSAGNINGGAVSLISAFPLSINLTNNTLTPYAFTFKAGSNFWANRGEYQNLIMVWDVTITINPGNNATIILPTFCLNPYLNAPSTSDDFILGTVYTGDCMGQIINILSTKNPATFDVAEIFMIQDAIWECLVNGFLTQARINQLNAL